MGCGLPYLRVKSCPGYVVISLNLIYGIGGMRVGEAEGFEMCDHGPASFVLKRVFMFH